MTYLITFLLLMASGTAGRTSPAPVEPSAVEASDSRVRRDGRAMLFAETPLTGTLTERWPDGSVKSVTSFVDGLTQGEAHGWYPDGTDSFVRSYGSGRKTGIHLGWWEDGSPKFEFNFVGGEHEGAAREWFRSGILYREFNYVEGHESGSQKMWYEDGSLRANYVVRDGRRYGLIGTKPCT
ncbi:MAG: antitoxin component YwqK of YwqJK toxin-antitoxin module [Rhodothermales bacterium]|jgi:antitoxin component YwqK of YwqJK toxin-antitoxin module